MKETPNAIEKTLLILNEFAKPPYHFTAKELSETLGISKPTIHRILNTLEEHNFVRRFSGEGVYSIGHRAYFVGMGYANSADVYVEIRHIVDDVSSTIGQQVGYAVLEGMDVVSLYESQFNDIRIRYMAGEVYSVNCGCYGKVLLAYSHPVEEFRQLVEEMELKPVTPGAITDKERFIAELKKIREQGYATSYDEYLEGTFGLGAPTFRRDGTVHGCITLGALNTPTNVKKEAYFAEEIKKGARRISDILL